ncbi:MAG: 7-cyano-7-deazaguanine synthase QueC [Actinobacteria bacterium]|uniref:7-cyano-7-deazaguanine synthase n=1 Tax=freshwater metagenome TaxID=449393 RepID=A0A6J5YUZ4_9ZZZZ|nr:7-cyano-7-deazaguanine synthase QueC [Actinomycetota bacterium]MSX33533.1 7-cyano-7-deazaguanine synthase QueC [Actinomycetota bacterium]MSX95366.1 7-cyano-7-deazaguanine synthase QueC [Actinomycetota bacterium]MTA41849.1 7-cyano-7-deazaguanine synthase QueC [Actinomycetota bacterium]MTA44006.1 7-cyano-7-deazaguanine synthase QueC [Actinomycetota bacterium]
MSKPAAIVLLSGGLDSTTCLAIAQSEGFEVVAVSFRYGQRHTNELECAAAIARSAGVEHLIVNIDLAAFGGSALVDDSIEVPKHESVEELTADSVPVTYVPARNTIFLSFATAVAETRGAHDVFIGVNAVDYSGYPDCRPEFIEAFEAMANLATREGVEGGRLCIRTPLIDLTKAQIIQRGLELGVDYSVTLSCYDPTDDGGSCGHCDACLLRARGFADAGISDPTRYSTKA